MLPKTFIELLIEYNTRTGTTVPTPEPPPVVTPSPTNDTAWRNEARALNAIALADLRAGVEACERLAALLAAMKDD